MKKRRNVKRTKKKDSNFFERHSVINIIAIPLTITIIGGLCVLLFGKYLPSGNNTISQTSPKSEPSVISTDQSQSKQEKNVDDAPIMGVQEDYHFGDVHCTVNGKEKHVAISSPGALLDLYYNIENVKDQDMRIEHIYVRVEDFYLPDSLTEYSGGQGFGVQYLSDFDYFTIIGSEKNDYEAWFVDKSILMNKYTYDRENISVNFKDSVRDSNFIIPGKSIAPLCLYFMAPKEGYYKIQVIVKYFQNTEYKEILSGVEHFVVIADDE